jgi:hypothetical protein
MRSSSITLLIGTFSVGVAAGQTIRPMCAHAGTTSDTITRPPVLTALVIPPPLPSKYRDSVVEIRVRVDLQGHSDSIVVSGISDAAYINQVRTAFVRMAFRPALDRGCPATGWYTLTVTSPNRKHGRS